MDFTNDPPAWCVYAGRLYLLIEIRRFMDHVGRNVTPGGYSQNIQRKIREMEIGFRDVTTQDFSRCIEIRGMTRDNPIPADILREFGVTEEAWAPLIRDKSILGVVAESRGEVIGFCSGDAISGEVLVLALLPEYEGRGVGKNMLALVIDKLFSRGMDKLWLAASADPKIRAHGFYRHLGWASTGMNDEHGDEVLEYRKT